jgi:hypothetical protein
MKIYIMISDDFMFNPRTLYRLLQRKGNEVCGVAEVSVRKTKKTKRNNQPTSLQFWGIKGFLILKSYDRFLRILKYFPLPSFIKGRLSNKNVCSFFKVPYEFIDDVNDPHFINHLKSLKPDIILSCQSQIFSEKLLNVARIACINCHPAKLPKYRGPQPILAAMINREDTIGVTIHSMTKEIDKGAIICQKEFATLKEYSLLDNYILAHELYSEVILEALDLIEKKDVSDFPLVQKDAPYFKSPSLQDLKKFRSSGLKMV